MRMVGHRTEAVYRRYAIVDETMMREGAEKLAILHNAEQSAARKHVAFSADRASTVQAAGFSKRRQK